MEQKRVFKTVKTVSGVGKIYRKWNDWQVGDVVIGTYESVGQDQYKKNSYSIKVIEAMFKSEPSDKYEGKTLAINANGMVDKALSELPIGTIVQIEYCGKSLIEKGPYAGKEAHSVKVDVVEESIDDSDEL